MPRSPSATGRLLHGIRVLEVAGWLAAPAAAAMMSDMGADVIKVEPPEGDAWRHLLPDVAGYAGTENPAFHLDNRGKRSIAIDLGADGGPDVVRTLARDCDVFITNLGPARAKRYGLAYRDIRRINPRVVYLQFTGYGAKGPQRDRPGFDDVAFWAGSGVMDLISEPGEPPVLGRASFGDHTTSLALLSGLLAALFDRERTGEGQYLQGSLFAAGLWVQGDVIQYLLETGSLPARRSRTDPMLALWNTYRLKDGAWIMLAMDTARFWPRICRALGLGESVATDPAFATDAALRANARKAVDVLDAALAKVTLRQAASTFTRERVIWAKVRPVGEAIEDPQVRANGYLAPLPGTDLRTLNMPVRFGAAEAAPRGPSPAIGEHTDEVLAGAGYGAAQIVALRAAGVVA